MKHLGDITKIKGSKAPVVDVIIGGSPCQDLSVAGKRAGLAGERSGLFMEQIRVIKEMREADVLRGRTDVDVRPRYGIWENVPGALSSPGKGHAGEDFAAVLEEFVRVAEPQAPSVSVPEKGWPTSGCLWDAMGKWSVAWRILDAQYWGVPQRRRRICLCADFNGLNAPRIVFGEVEHNGEAGQGGGESSFGNSGREPRSSIQPVTESVSGNPEPGEQEGEETPGNAGAGIGGAVPCTLKIRGGCSGGKGALIQQDKSATLSTLQDQTLFQPVAFTDTNILLDDQGGQQISVRVDGKANCDFREDSETYIVTGVDCRNATEWPEMNSTLQSDAAHNLNSNNVVRIKHIVRRLTPLECDRLQGFPDDWTDIGEWEDSKGKLHKEADSPRYKALGNSIAIPPWKWVLKRLCACYERDATMASLFDGIGGFPYIWEQLNGKGSCLWASEIEEFPMAVTKVRFGE